jgi:type II secretory pathway component PulF
MHLNILNPNLIYISFGYLVFFLGDFSNFFRDLPPFWCCLYQFFIWTLKISFKFWINAMFLFFFCFYFCFYVFKKLKWSDTKLIRIERDICKPPLATKFFCEKMMDWLRNWWHEDRIAQRRKKEGNYKPISHPITWVGPS